MPTAVFCAVFCVLGIHASYSDRRVPRQVGRLHSYDSSLCMHTYLYHSYKQCSDAILGGCPGSPMTRKMTHAKQI